MEAVLFFAFALFAFGSYWTGRMLRSSDTTNTGKLLILLAFVAAIYVYSYIISGAIERANP